MENIGPIMYPILGALSLNFLYTFNSVLVRQFCNKPGSFSGLQFAADGMLPLGIYFIISFFY
jgi:hypothetical protein